MMFTKKQIKKAKTGLGFRVSADKRKLSHVFKR